MNPRIASARSGADGAPRPLADVVREVYLSRASGAVRIAEVDGAPSVLRFRDGELFVTPQAASALAAAVEAAGDEAMTAPQVAEQVRALARRYPPAARGVFALEPEPPPQLSGPAPAVWLAIELAVHGHDAEAIAERLGGAGARLRAPSRRSPALEQVSRLDDEMERALRLLGEQPTVASLEDGSRGDAAALLRGCAKLHAAGLAEPVHPDAGGEVDGRSIRRLADHVAESLRGTPVDLPSGEHRRHLADYLSRLGELDHYTLLDVPHDADAAQVAAAYDRLARLVHPSHAARLGLEGRDEPLRVVFERATEAYLTLSDPHRRVAYNRMIGLQVTVAVDDRQRVEEKRDMARRCYRRATSALAAQEVSTAVDLLSEACRLDPRPEYWALLGRAQARNPRWSDRAIASLERAATLAPDDAGICVIYGALLEKLGRTAEARREYQKALRLDSQQIAAHKGLARLGGADDDDIDLDGTVMRRRRGLLGFLRRDSG